MKINLCFTDLRLHIISVFQMHQPFGLLTGRNVEHNFRYEKIVSIFDIFRLNKTYYIKVTLSRLKPKISITAGKTIRITQNQPFVL